VFERFTDPARQVVVAAQEEARLLKHDYIGTEHILLGLLRADEGVAARALRRVGVTLERARAEVANSTASGKEVTAGQVRLTPRAKKVLEIALREALAFRDGPITTGHILLALTRVNEGTAARVLFDLGTDVERLSGEVLALRSRPTWEKGAWEEPMSSGATPAPTYPPGPLRATAVRAVVEVALYAAAAKAREEDRLLDLGHLLLALAERWPDDLVARTFAELEIDLERVREAVEAARRRRE
jgi:Clp amino terminal domain, pathogenicity island component